MFAGQAVFFTVLVIAILVIIAIAKTATVVPQQSAFVIESLGKFSKTLSAGFHILIPFIERIAYKHSLKEQAVDIPEQVCITRDNVQVGIDGVLYLQVLDAKNASYGITNYQFAISQLAQTTLRSEIGKIDLDRTFEERATINSNVVSELDKASETWGVKVLRYEIKNINPPHDVLSAMEKQMRAEREKRAVILNSEGVRDANINEAEGEKQRVIKESEAAKQQQINEAEGEAQAILAVATATAEGLRQVAIAVNAQGGRDAMQLRVAEDYVKQFGNLAKVANTLIVPANLSDVASMIAMATKVFEHGSADHGPIRNDANGPADRSPA
ncbi:MAG TPA: stomatin-like protein [Burkholderiales bacterium]|nr:stomatin-like protein [Burkholderiales bacterium]